MLLILKVVIGVVAGLAIWKYRASLLGAFLETFPHAFRFVLFVLLAVGVVALIGWAGVSQNPAVQIGAMFLVAGILWWARRRETRVIRSY